MARVEQGISNPNPQADAHLATTVGRKRTNTSAGGRRVTASAQESKERYRETAKDDKKFEEFAFALTGKTAGERTPKENAALKQLRQEMRNGEISPEFVEADPANSSGDDRLPTGVRGAYVSGGKGRQGRVLISPSLRGRQLERTSDEEQGEAVADRAAQLGIGVADGDAGARISGVVNGRAVTRKTDPALFKNAASDTVTVVSNGEVVEAEADAQSGSPAQTTLTIEFKKGSKAQSEVQYYDETTQQWITVATGNDGNGNATVTVPGHVTLDKIRINNLRDGGTYQGNGTNARSSFASNGTTIGFEDKNDDDSFDDVKVTTTAVLNQPPAPSADGTEPFNVRGPDGQAYNLNDPNQREAYLKQFDKDGNGYLYADEAAEAFGGTAEHGQWIVRMYGTSNTDRTNVGIPVSENDANNTIGVDQMIADGSLFLYTDADGSTRYAVDLAGATPETAANAMIRAEAQRRKEDGDERPMAQIIWEIETRGMNAQEMDWATDHLFGDKDPLNPDNGHADAIAENFGFRNERGDKQLVKASMVQIFSQGALKINQDKGDHISISAHREPKPPAAYWEQIYGGGVDELEGPSSDDDDGHLTLNFTTDETVTVYATIYDPVTKTWSKKRIYTRPAGGPDQVNIIVPLEPGQQVGEFSIETEAGGERTVSQPGPEVFGKPAWSSQESGNAVSTHFFETSANGNDYKDVEMTWMPPASTYTRHETQYEAYGGKPTIETYGTQSWGNALAANPNLQVQYYDPNAAGGGQWQAVPPGQDISIDNSHRNAPPVEPQMRVVDTSTNTVVAGAEVPGTMKRIKSHDGTTTFYFSVTGSGTTDFNDVAVKTTPSVATGASGPPTPDVEMGNFVDVPIENELYPEQPLGAVHPGMTFEEAFPMLPSDEQDAAIQHQATRLFVDEITNQPEGSNAKILHNLLVTKQLAQSGEYQGEVDMAALDKDIQKYSKKADVVAIRQKAEQDITSRIVGGDPKTRAAEAEAWLLSPETRIALAAMPPEKRQAFIQKAISKVMALDPAAGARVYEGLTTNLYKGVAAEDVALEKSALAAVADQKEANGLPLTAEEQKAKDDVEAAAADTFETVTTKLRGVGGAASRLASSLETWAKGSPGQASKFLSHFTKNLNEGMTFEQAVSGALKSSGAPARVAADMTQLMAIDVASAVLGGMGMIFGVFAVGQDFAKLANGGDFTAEDRLNLTADIFATLGGVSTTGKRIISLVDPGNTKSSLHKLHEFQVADQAFDQTFQEYKAANQIHQANTERVASAEERVANAEETVRTTPEPENYDPLATPEDMTPEQALWDAAIEERDAALAEKEAADAAWAESSIELRKARRNTQTAYNLARSKQEEAKIALGKDPRIPGSASKEVWTELEPDYVSVNDEGKQILVGGEPEDLVLFSKIHKEQWKDPAIMAQAEREAATAPWYRSAKFTTGLKVVGALGDAASIFYGVGAAMKADQLRQAGDTTDAALEGTQAAVLIGGGAVGIAGLISGLAGWEAAAALFGPVGIVLGLAGFAIAAVTWARSEQEAKAIQQKTYKDFINNTGTGREYAR
ncbi:hypothetical protein [Yoonia sp. 2307UL14-13]|uniref:hypothetical protein n=1 Tax=Yoonia sp. 2307UL14-13 TaxID=3126506 RepID=UPI00309CFC5C